MQTRHCHSQLQPSLPRQLARAASEILFLAAAGGVLVYATLTGISREMEIREQSLPDRCRVAPAQCDLPARGPHPVNPA